MQAPASFRHPGSGNPDSLPFSPPAVEAWTRARSSLDENAALSYHAPPGMDIAGTARAVVWGERRISPRGIPASAAEACNGPSVLAGCRHRPQRSVLDRHRAVASGPMSGCRGGTARRHDRVAFPPRAHPPPPPHGRLRTRLGPIRLATASGSFFHTLVAIRYLGLSGLSRGSSAPERSQ